MAGESGDGIARASTESRHGRAVSVRSMTSGQGWMRRPNFRASFQPSAFSVDVHKHKIR